MNNCPKACFTDTGAGPSVLNPNEGRTMETDPFLKGLVRIDGVDMALQGLGGKDILVHSRVQLQLNTADEKPVETTAVILPHHFEGMPHIYWAGKQSLTT